MKYRIEIYIPIEPEEELTFDTYEEAVSEAEHLELMQPENLYRVVLVDEAGGQQAACDTDDMSRLSGSLQNLRDAVRATGLDLGRRVDEEVFDDDEYPFGSSLDHVLVEFDHYLERCIDRINKGGKA